MQRAAYWPGEAHMYRGYAESCLEIVSEARRFSAALMSRFSNDLYILGDPKISVVAFGSRTVDPYVLGDRMSKKGWHLNALASPPALHMAFTVSFLGQCPQLTP